MRSMPLGSEMGGTFISAFWCKGKGKPVRRKLFREAALCKEKNVRNLLKFPSGCKLIASVLIERNAATSHILRFCF